MKFSRLTTMLLVVNVLLVAAVAYLSYRLIEVSTRPPAVVVKTVTKKTPVAVKPPPQVVTVVKTNEFQWQQLESEDYRTYIGRLRAIGCPEETIRDIIMADIDKLLAPKMQAAAPKHKDLKYWQPEEKELWNPLEDLDADQQRQDIDFQKRDILRELVGIDLVAERLKVQGQDDIYGKRLGFLPEDKRIEVRKLLDKYSRAELALRERIWEEGDSPEDAAKLAKLQREQQSAVSRLMTPEQFHQYELWMSPTAYQVRDSLFGMNPNENEFLTVYNLKKTFDEQWHPEEIADDASRQRLADAQQELENKIHAQLGEQRYAEYQRAQDQDFRQLSAAVARSQLPAAKAAEVYEMKKIALQQREQVQADASLSPEQRQAALQALAAAAQGPVRQALGEKAFNYYLRHSGAEWLR